MEGASSAIARAPGPLKLTAARKNKDKTLRTKTRNLKLQTRIGPPEGGPSD